MEFTEVAAVDRFLVMTPMLTGRDGISEVSRQVVRSLVAHARPEQIEAWTLDGPAPTVIDRLPAIVCRRAEGRRRDLIRWTAGRLWGARADDTVIVMHAHLAPLAAMLGARGARVVVFIHGVEVWQRLRPLERAAFAAADCVVANSARTVERFRAANSWWGNRSVHVALLGVAEPTSAAPAAERRGFALIVGRLHAAERYKGHDALIDAWPAVRGKVADARLVIAGDGDDRPRLEARVRDAGLADAIQFVGRVDDARLRGLYQACGAFVMPSTGEGFGLAYLEAMREGKPCIALRSANEIIEDGVTGVLIETPAPTALAAALVSLLSDDRYRERLGTAAAARVAAHFTETAFARRFSDAIGLHAHRADPTTVVNPAGHCA